MTQYELQVWNEPLGKWRVLGRGQLDIMKRTEDDLISENMLHPAANTRIIRATGTKEYHFGEGSYDYEV